MICPKCGTEMFETHERVRIDHPFASKPRTLKHKTRFKRLWICPKCNIKFVPKLVLKAV